MPESAGLCCFSGEPVATLSVWRFPTALGAEQAEHTLEQLAKQELLKVQDAARAPRRVAGSAAGSSAPRDVDKPLPRSTRTTIDRG
jgi:hypothetical protein